MDAVMIREQPRWEALVETGLNIGSGFFISWAMWVWVIAPLWNIPFNMMESLEITALFTITSVIRSYFWRRLTNWKAKYDVRNS